MKKNLIHVLAVSGMFLALAPLSSAEVYTWKGRSGSVVYSDVPNQLKPSRSATVNVRTHNVHLPQAQPATEDGDTSLAEQQGRLNEKITHSNKQIEEQNKKIEEQNQQMKADNCKTARLNRQFAESARAQRDALISRYDADINKYCS